LFGLCPSSLFVSNTFNQDEYIYLCILTPQFMTSSLPGHAKSARIDGKMAAKSSMPQSDKNMKCVYWRSRENVNTAFELLRINSVYIAVVVFKATVASSVVPVCISLQYSSLKGVKGATFRTRRWNVSITLFGDDSFCCCIMCAHGHQ